MRDVNRVIIPLLLVVLIGSGGYFLVQSRQSGGTTQTTAVQPAAVPVQNASPVANSASPSREIEVRGSEYSFNPKSIDLKAGETVSIKYKNVGNLPHDFVITGLAAKTNVLQAGQEQTITVTAAQAGTYTFYCSVGNHKQLGMEGTVTVK